MLFFPGSKPFLTVSQTAKAGCVQMDTKKLCFMGISAFMDFTASRSCTVTTVIPTFYPPSWSLQQRQQGQKHGM